MNLDEVRQIIRLMDDNRLVEFEVEEAGKRIRLRRGEEAKAIQTVVAAAPVPAQAVPAPSAPADGKPVRASNLTEFRSPLVGTFYRASRPDAEPFVNVGDEVAADKVLCIIEAMKVMNEIRPEMEGVVREILVKNGQAVEFGELLFLIEKK